ncbi:hypothetical protein LDENG_00274820 [Lucifuga dentata]|nr:hypothetical protein LDENG_00274820 [Lucifuga dentata]
MMRMCNCKECCGVWYKGCLQKTSEDWHLSSSDNSSGEEFIPDSVSESETLSHLSDAKYNRASTLPLTRDVKKFHTHLNQQAESALRHLTDKASTASYAMLARVTLCQVILFNRRRAGEVSKMTLKNYQDRDISKLNDDVSAGLSEVERRLCKTFSRVELKGKRGRKAAIILTPDMVTALSLLVSKRKECEVDDSNTYLFAVPRCQSHYRGQDCIGAFADLCGAENPQNLQSANLPKHIATISQVLNLKENEMDQLADFLGHDIRVHREYYRLPHSTVQVAKISKLLMAMERGNMTNLQGKSLDQIGGVYHSKQAELEVSENECSTANADDIADLAELPTGSQPALVDESVSQGAGSTIPQKKKTVMKRPWSQAEINAVVKHLKDKS